MHFTRPRGDIMQFILGIDIKSIVIHHTLNSLMQTNDARWQDGVTFANFLWMERVH